VEFIVKARNMELNDDLRSRAEKKIKDRITRFIDKVLKIEVEFTFESNPKINLNNRVEVTVFASGNIIRAVVSAADAFEAIDRVAEKIERQVKKYHNKLIQKSRKPSNNGFVPRDTFSEDTRKQIVKTKTFTLKPLSPEEAVMQMEMIGHDFFVFINSETEETAVVYRRKDGNYGLIEPTT